MEVLGMAGKLLRNISPDKIENRDVEYYKQALDLTDCPVIQNLKKKKAKYSSKSKKEGGFYYCQ